MLVEWMQDLEYPKYVWYDSVIILMCEHNKSHSSMAYKFLKNA